MSSLAYALSVTHLIERLLPCAFGAFFRACTSSARAAASRLKPLPCPAVMCCGACAEPQAYLYLDDITLPALMPSTTSPDKRNGEQPPSTDAGSETKTVPDKASPIPQNGGGPTSGTGTDTGVGKPGEKAAAGPGGGSIINTNENKPAITVVTPKPERSAASRPHASGAVALLVLACVSACLLL
jgi:hypothetical protein